ncbi:MAG: hypothetical protein WBM50_04125 [Acidimicrobiales bacterium]
MDRKQETVTKTAFTIACHNFSDIRRRPLVIGKLDQVRLPFVVTMPQLAVGAIVFAVLFATRPAWGAVLSDRLHILVFVAAPVVVAQQVSRTTVEGRSLSKAALALIRLWLAPRHGTMNGRRQRPADTTRLQLRPLVDERDRRPRDRRAGDRKAPGDGDRGRLGSRRRTTRTSRSAGSP